MKKVYIIDWNSFIYRMFFALPEFTTKNWQVVNALFWMAKFFANTLVAQNPDYLIFIKDAKGINFRHELYEKYKATRNKMPDNLITQIPLIEEMIKLMNVEIVEIPWFEADDVIWTLTTNLWKNTEFEINILTWDKDLYSLVSENVFIYDTMKKKKFWPKETLEKFWIKKEFIIDYLAIVWDSSDNIPWINNFWPKKAVDLINTIWWIEKIFEEVEKVEKKEKSDLNFPLNIQPYFRWNNFEILKNSKEIAFLSKQLATIKLDVPLENFNIENFKFDEKNIVNKNILTFFEKYEFNSLVWDEWTTKLESCKDLWLDVHIIDNNEDLEKLKETCLNEKEIVLDTETTSLNIMKTELVWISIYIDDERIYYINKLHFWNKVSLLALQNFVQDILNSDILIVWHNLKYDLEVLDMFLGKTSEDEKQLLEDSQNVGKNPEEFLVQTSLF